jgi:ABC-type lipoprotein release transport system permease subunit
MDKLGYVIEEAGLSILRQKGTALLRLSFGMLYSLSFILLARGWVTLLQLESNEKENALKNSNPINALLENNTDQTLISFLGILKFAFLIICLAMLIFVAFYLFSFLQKQFLLEKGELQIKAYLGSSALKITGEFFAPIAIILAFGGICGIICGNYLYLQFYKRAVWWVKEVLHSSTHYLVIVDIPFVLLMTVLLGLQFLYMKQKITVLN